MNTYSQIYWVTRLDYLKGFFITFLVISSVLLLAYVVCWIVSKADIDGEEFVEWFKKIQKKIWFMWLVFTFSIIGVCFIPTTDEAIVIIAGGKTLNFIQTDSSLNKIPGQTTALIQNILETEMKKLEKAVDKK